MPPETSFHEQLQSHRGGLFRVVTSDAVVDGLSMGKIGLLLSAEPAQGLVEDIAKVKLLIDGSVLTLYAVQENLELIGSDDA
jgi:hypothetical protein